jgi:hypothetical protein
MQDPKSEKPVRQRELPRKHEPVQQQPANDRSGAKESSRTSGVRSSLQIRTAHCGANSTG